MTKSTMTAARAIVLLLALLAASTVQAEKPVRIGWTAWSSTEAVMNIAREVLEEKMGYRVEPLMADIGIQYQGVARGDIDVMLMAWLPVTHKPYWDRFAGELVDLGPIYLGARLGWAVPGYIPESEIRSIADLAKPEVARKLRGQIQGIDPGSGLMQASEQALEAYGLDDYKLISASGAGMTAALQRAARRDQWIVVTAWSPHWMFARWNLRYLEDPKGVLGGKERVHALVRPGFYQDYPDEVTAFLTRFHLPLEDVEAVMLEATDSSYEEAAKKYVRTHPRRVQYWVTGTFPE